MIWAWLTQWTGVDWQSVVFAQPEWFWAFAAVPAWVALARLWQHWRNIAPSDDLVVLSQAGTARFRHPLVEKFLQQRAQFQRTMPKRGWQRLALNLLRLLILSFAILALAQPELLKTPPPQAQQKTVRDIDFVIESSVSFVLPDYQLNNQPATRMQVVKKVLDQFMAGLTGNRFGLSVFAEQAYTLLPLTPDAMAARLTLQRLRPNLAGRTDEGMGEALGLALQQEDETSQTGKHTLKRIIVLISDGLSRPSKIPLGDIITYAKAMNVPIYTVGVGSGSASADQRKTSGLIYAPLDPTPLKQLAESTGGQYYHVGSGEDLHKVLQAIDRSAGVPLLGVTPPKRHIALYHWPLGVAVLLWMLYALLAPWLMRLGSASSATSQPTSAVTSMAKEGGNG
jgi:Ca-activated chloride channel family protein